MCGICGIVRPSENADELRAIIKRMADSIAHRGPDGEGTWTTHGVALGHRRLSIIDIAGGAQPMVDKRGYVISYNGELYNFHQLRSELEIMGETFSTHSDTEVVLKAFIRWGDSALERFNGMYAFAIYLTEEQEVFLARDRIGIKPLYYAIQGDSLVFGSEIKALTASGAIGHDVDLTMVPFFLAKGYFPNGYTPYAAVKQVQPGSWLRFKGTSLRQGTYWDLGAIFRAREPRRVTPEDRDELKHLISDAVRMQIIADVPVGTYLSGGMDSGIVTATLASSGAGDIETFSVGITEDPEMDEIPLARQVARRYASKRHEISISADQMLEHWERLLEHFDMPYSDSSALPTYLISRFAADKVKVILSGDGGDEQWGGYGNYRRYAQMVALRRLLVGPFGRRAVGATASLASKWISGQRPRLSDRLAYYGGLLSEDGGRLYDKMDNHATDTLIGSLAGERLLPHYVADAADTLMRRDPADHLDGVMLGDLGVFMVDDVLRKVDMMSMAVGLEVRVPLLDHRIVEKSIGLSWRDKVKGGQTKKFIRELYADDLPPAVVAGGKKGFGVPLDRWFRGPLKAAAESILLDPSCGRRGILRPDTVQLVLAEHADGRKYHGKLILAMLALEKWLAAHEAT